MTRKNIGCYIFILCLSNMIVGISIGYHIGVKSSGNLDIMPMMMNNNRNLERKYQLVVKQIENDSSLYRRSWIEGKDDYYLGLYTGAEEALRHLKYYFED